MNTKQLLDQDQLWLTADRMPIPLVEMDPSHRRATLAFLRRRAEYLRKAYRWCEERAFLSAPDDVYAQYAAERHRALAEPAADWLDHRPLLQELARLVRKDELDANTVDGEVVPERLELGRA